MQVSNISAVLLILLSFLIVGGCSSSGRLPEPRLPDDDEIVADAPAQPPAAATNPPAANAPASGTTPNAPQNPPPAPATANSNVANPNVKTSTAPVANSPATPTIAAANPPAANSPATNSPPSAAGPATAPVPAPAQRALPTSATAIAPIRPGNQLTLVERRQHSIACMQVIAAALEQFHTKHRRYPDSYYHYDDAPYLSWRVELLPYLGYAELYKKFDYKEPWDSPNNRRLVAEIPPVYQSPERGDERTNFLLAIGQYTAYVSSSGPRDEAYPDGLENTILLVEVDDAHAVPWTKPDDWRVEVSQPRAGLFSLREDGFFAVMGKGALRQIPYTIVDSQLSALWTARGGEAVELNKWTTPPSDIADEKLVAAFRAGQVKETKAASTATAANTVTTNPSDPDRPQSPAEDSSSTATTLRRPAIPPDSDLKRAEALVKQVYGDRYSKAKTAQERRELATTMLNEAESVRQELASYYAILRIARDIATNAGDMTSARTAMQHIENTFEMNLVEQKLAWLDTATKFTSNTTDAALLAEEASNLFEVALAQDDFDACRDLNGLFAALAKKSGDEKLIQKVPGFRDRFEASRKAYGKIADHLHVLLRSPDDLTANQEVGKYLCFVKRQWEAGSAHLARGSDGPLKQVASLEQQRPTSTDAQAILGDTYWSLSETPYFSAHEAALRDRAVYWYRLALPQQPDGLRKALIQERLRLAEEPSAKGRRASQARSAS